VAFLFVWQNVSHIAEQTMMLNEDALSRFNKQARVKVELIGGKREVEAVVWGVWAIHRSVYFLESKANLYTLTHIPTGAEVATNSSQRALAELAARLDALGDWSSSKRERLPIQRALEVLEQWREEVNSKRQ
jgi:hypothetical protein